MKELEQEYQYLLENMQANAEYFEKAFKKINISGNAQDVSAVTAKISCILDYLYRYDPKTKQVRKVIERQYL